jgi:hypothetical protein
MPSSKLQWKEQPGGGVSTYIGGVYCGPGWGFTKEDVISGKIRSLPKAIDAIDEACKHHDQCYQDYGYFWQSCNVGLAHDLVKVITDPKSSSQQRMDATIMAAIFSIEAKYVDTLAYSGSFSYKYLKSSIENLWKNGNLTMEQVMNQMEHEILNQYGMSRYGTF